MEEGEKDHRGQKRDWTSANHGTGFNWLDFAQQSDSASAPSSEDRNGKIIKLTDQVVGENSPSSPEVEASINVPEITEISTLQSDSEDETDAKNLQRDLASWAKKFEISTKALDELLEILGLSPLAAKDSLSSDVGVQLNGNNSRIDVEICQDFQVDSVRTQDDAVRNGDGSKSPSTQLQLHPNASPSTPFEQNLDIKLNLVLRNQQLMMTSIARLLTVDEPSDEQEELPAPIREVKDLEALSQKLQEDPALTKKMVQRLASIGGRNLSECVRKIMKCVGKNELWSQYSFKGRKGKRALEPIYICKVIVKACLRLNSDWKVRDIEGAIGDVLKYAPKRSSITVLQRRAIKLEPADLIPL